MSYVYERDGPMACPDDPSRTGDAQELSLAEEKHYYSQVALHQEELKDRMLDLIFDFQTVVELKDSTLNKNELAQKLLESFEPEEIMVLIRAIYTEKDRIEASQFIETKLKDFAEETAKNLAQQSVNWT